MNRYTDIPVFKNKDNFRYYAESKYPEIDLSGDDIWVITTVGDRYDLLAQQYYGNKSLWWIIPAANNNLPKNSLYPPVGEQLRIPVNVNNILFEYKKVNNFIASGSIN